MLFHLSFVLSGALLSLAVCGSAALDKEAGTNSGEAAAVREYFYVGGDYVPIGTEHLFSNQMCE